MSGNINDTNPSKLGGGVPGFQPKLLGGGANGYSGSGMIGGGARGLSRILLRESYGRRNWLNKFLNVQTPLPLKSGTFRLTMNAGDILGTVNEAPLKGLPSSNQVNSILVSRQGVKADSVQHGKAAYSGNPKYVYDSSDFIKFKKLQAQLKSYNDKSYGGSNNGSYSFLNRVRH